MNESEIINEIEFENIKSDVLNIITNIQNTIKNKKKLIIIYKLIKRLYSNE